MEFVTEWIFLLFCYLLLSFIRFYRGILKNEMEMKATKYTSHQHLFISTFNCDIILKSSVI